MSFRSVIPPLAGNTARVFYGVGELRGAALTSLLPFLSFISKYCLTLVSTVTTNGMARMAPEIPDNLTPTKIARIVTKGGNPTTRFMTRGTIS